MPDESFGFDQTLKTMFQNAGHLFGLEFQEEQRPQENIRAFSVLNKETHNKVGLLYVDPHASGLKTTFSSEGAVPTVTITMNLPKPVPGQEAVLSLADTQALFKLNGHALHNILGVNRLKYPAL